MKIVKLKGGLGNQMFQYAYAKLWEKRTGETVKIDYSTYEALKDDKVRKPRITNFQLSLLPATKKEIASVCKLTHTGMPNTLWYKAKIFLESKINKKYIFEPDRAYIHPDKVKDGLYYNGYWQSWRYVDEVMADLWKEYVPANPLSTKTQKFQMKMQGENAVFVGVRKGDYTTEPKHYGSFDSQYYQKAMVQIEEKVKDPVYYVFSNDIDWSKHNIDWQGRNIIYREPEDQTSDFEELMLMASCKHAIIVNSTYHWWGAQLIKSGDKIICCPEKWFFDNAPIDIIPTQWTRIPV